MVAHMGGDEVAKPCAGAKLRWHEGVSVGLVAGGGAAELVLVLIPVEAIMDEQRPVVPIGVDHVERGGVTHGIELAVGIGEGLAGLNVGTAGAPVDAGCLGHRLGLSFGAVAYPGKVAGRCARGGPRPALIV